MLPVLHLNEAKISGPTVLGRADEDDVVGLLRSHGYAPVVVARDDPHEDHRDFAIALDEASASISEIQRRAREDGDRSRPTWPAVILRTPKGWTGPREVDGQRVEGTFRSHQVRFAAVRENAGHLALLEEWMRTYRPDERFDDDARLVAELQALAPDGDKRIGATSYANGGRRLRPLDIPDLDRHAVAIEAAA